MKNVRVFFEKHGPCKYISHLDTNRVMLRAIGKSRLDIWYTEGFNRHAYITFALPLSLGFASFWMITKTCRPSPRGSMPVCLMASGSISVSSLCISPPI